MVILKNFSSDIGILNFIESWMIYGTDYWFISPMLYEKLSIRKRDRILKDILETNYYPTLQLEYSIFDDIRKFIISSEIENSGSKEIIENEKHKMELFK